MSYTPPQFAVHESFWASCQSVRRLGTSRQGACVVLEICEDRVHRDLAWFILYAHFLTGASCFFFFGLQPQIIYHSGLVLFRLHCFGGLPTQPPQVGTCASPSKPTGGSDFVFPISPELVLFSPVFPVHTIRGRIFWSCGSLPASAGASSCCPSMRASPCSTPGSFGVEMYAACS